MSSKRHILVLFSGGADSTLLIHWALKLADEVTPVIFSYGQVHKEEVVFARNLVRSIDGTDVLRPARYVDLSGAFAEVKSCLLAGAGQAVEKDYPSVNIHHVPGRNAIFMSIALGIAESCGADEVWIGSDYTDREDQFPDCYQEWVLRMNSLAQINGSRPIKVKAPLLGWHKEDVLAMLVAEGFDLTKIFSGYAPPSCDSK